MSNSKGFGLIELLLSAVIILALGYLFMRQRQHQTVDFQKQMKEAGVKMPVNPGTAAASTQALEKAVEAQLKATTEQQDKALEKTLDGGN